MASRMSGSGTKPKWPGRESHLSTGSDSDVNLTVDSILPVKPTCKSSSKAEVQTPRTTQPSNRSKQEVTLETWDPMMEDYNNKSFNSYNRGPGAGLAGTECNKPSSKKQKYSLFVGNIPTEMTEEGLSNLFSHCCDILQVKVCQSRDDSRDTTFGFVDVPSVKDGEDAIKRLDGHVIRHHRLKVSFKREKEKASAETLLLPRDSPEEWDPPISASKKTSPNAKTRSPGSRGGRKTSSSESDGSTSEQKRKPPQPRKMEDRYGFAKKHVSNEETQDPSPKGAALINQTKRPVQAPEVHVQGSGAGDKAAPSPLQALLQRMRSAKQDAPEQDPAGSRSGDSQVTLPEHRGQIEGIRKEDSKAEEAVSRRHGKRLFSEEVSNSATPKERQEARVSKAETKKLVEEQVKSDSDTDSTKAQEDVSSGKTSKLPQKNDYRGILGPAPRGFFPQHKSQALLPLKQPLLPLDTSACYCPECAMQEYHDTKGAPHSYPYLPHHQCHQPRNGPYNPNQFLCSCFGGGYPPDEPRQMFHHHAHPYPHRSPPYATAAPFGPAHYGVCPQHHYSQAHSLRYNPPPQHGYYEGRDPHQRAYPAEGLGSAGYQNSGYQTSRSSFTTGARHESLKPTHKFQKALPGPSHSPSPNQKWPPKSTTEAIKAVVTPPKSPSGDSQADQKKEPVGKTAMSKGRETTGQTEGPSAAKLRNLTSEQRKKEPMISPQSNQERAVQNCTSAGVGSTLLAAAQRSPDKETKEGQSGQKDPKQCVNCGKPGHLRCTKCKSTYCSAECQKKHWPTHKQHCRKVTFQDGSSSQTTSATSSRASTPPKKSLQVIHDGTEDIFMARNLPFETPTSVEMEVVITEVESPSLFWVQLPQESSIHGLLELCQSLNTTYQDQSSAAKFSYKAQVGGLCAAWYVADSSWYRAEVLSLDNQKCTVQLIDFGTMDVVSVDGLRKLEDKNFKLPKQALRCHLSGVQPILESWTKDATERLKTQVNKHEGCLKAKFIGQRAGSHEVQLYSGDDPTQTISSILISATLAEKPTSTAQNKPGPNLVDTAPAKSPRPASVLDGLVVSSCLDVCVSHVDSPSCFFAFLAESIESLKELDDGMNTYYAATAPQMGFRPQPGKLFAARYSLNQSWYRAVTNKLYTKQNPSLLVTFVDYGNSEILNLDECRPLEDRFSTLPWQAISCALAGIKPNTADDQWPDETTTAFRKWLMDGLSKIVIKAKQGDKLVVEIFMQDREMSFNTWLHHSGYGEDKTDPKANQDKPVSAAATPKHLPNAEVPLSEFQGFVTVVNNPNDFYLQVDSEENRSAFKTFSEHLNTRYTLQDFSPYKPSVGEYCAAIFEDSAWYRAKVLSYVATESAFKLLFVDYGHTVLLPSDRIRQLENRFYEMPMMALHCSLTCVMVPSSGNSGWNDAAQRHFRDKVHNQRCQVNVVKSQDGKCDVELLYPVESTDKLVSVKRELLQKGWALLKDSSHNSASKSDDHKPTNEMPSGKISVNASGDSTSANHEACYSASTNQDCALPAPKLPAEDFQGLVTVVGNYGDVYLQIATQENVDNMQSLTEGLNEHYTLVQQRPHEAGVGELCAVQYSLDGVWYRGQVVSHSKTDQTASVLFVDYGNTEVVSLDEIQKLEKRFTENPSMALHCYLSGLTPPSGGEMWNGDAIEHLKKQVLDKACHIRVTKHDGELCEVEILYSNDHTSWLSINEELINKGLAKPIKDQTSPGPSGDYAATNQKQATSELALKNGEHNPESLPLGLSGDKNPGNCSNSVQGVDERAGLAKLLSSGPPPPEFTGILTSLNNPCDFYLQIKNDEYIELSQVLRAELNQHYPQPGGGPHVPRVGELCAAKYSCDDEWYRAMALEHSDSTASTFKVMFVDYGNCEVVPADGLEKLEGDFLEVPSLAHHCCLSGVMAPSGDKQGPWSAEAAAFISAKLIPRDLECHVRVLKHDGKVCEVEIHYSSDDGGQTYNLKEELLKSGLAEPVPITKPRSAETRTLASSIVKATIPNDSVVDVMVNEVVSPLEFYCQIVDREENLKLHSLMEEINSHAPDHPLTAPPMVGDLCLAKFTADETWYRTEILKLKQADKRALVYYLDFGNKEPLPWSQLAAPDRKFTDLPSQAIRCGLAGIPPGSSNDETMVSFLREHLIGDGTNPPIILKATMDSTASDGTALVQLVQSNTDTNFNQVVKDMVSSSTSPVPSTSIHPTSSVSPATPVISPKVVTSDPARREALRREMELKKQQLEAQIEAHRRELAEMEQLRAKMDQDV